MTRHLALLLAAATSGVPSAYGQCGTGSVDAFDTFTVTAPALELPQPGTVDFDRGSTAPGHYTVTVTPSAPNADRTWYLCLQAEESALHADTGGSKPVGHLQWSIDGRTWTALTVSTQTVRLQTGLDTFPLHVRLLLDYANDGPGSYGPVSLSFQVSH